MRLSSYLSQKGLKVIGASKVRVPGKKKSKTKNESQGEMKRQPMHLSNSQKWKLKKLQEEKENKALELKSISILEKYKIQDNMYSLLQSSGNMGQVETKREKRRRAIQLSKAGLEMPHDDPPLKKRVSHAIFDQSEFAAEVDTDNDKSCYKQDHLDDCSPQSIIVERDAISSHGIFDSHQMETCRQNTEPATHTTLTILEVDNNNTGKCTRWDQNTPAIASCNYVGGEKTKPQVWLGLVPLRVEAFCWLAVIGKVATLDNLCRRGMMSDDMLDRRCWMMSLLTT